MKRFVEGISRDQSTLFPERLDDFIVEDNPVRAIDVFVEQLDLLALGFERVVPSHTGRPAFHPAVLLKLYIYGYLNRIQSSRRLERETQRNVEMMWLTERLSPDFKTIADFRKDNGQAIVRVCREFVGLCRQLDLFTQAVVAIDGSKFKAVNSGDRNFTSGRIKQHKKRVESHIALYLNELEVADQEGVSVPEQKVTDLKGKLARLEKQLKELHVMEMEVARSPGKQVSLTDPDARVMATQRKNSGVVGYNVQSAVDTKHHLIVAHDVTNDITDRGQLSRMAKAARDAMGTEELTAVADRGYFSGPEIHNCQQAGIRPLCPKPRTSSSRKTGQFTKDDFRYDPEQNQYLCPAGEVLSWRFQTVERGLNIDVYFAAASACNNCTIKDRCTNTKLRRIRRWEHEASVDAMLDDLAKHPEQICLRKQTAEHPFGTLKLWAGTSHFLTRRLKNVRTEMSLQVLAYNLKRVMSILGVLPLITAMRV